MWKLTAVVDAFPRIFLGVASAGITCLSDTKRESEAGAATSLAILTVSIKRLKVAADVVVLVIIISVTIVVVDVLGTVYKSVSDVAAAVLARTLDVTAISYCLS
jgi:hypothetical protein